MLFSSEKHAHYIAFDMCLYICAVVPQLKNLCALHF